MTVERRQGRAVGEHLRRRAVAAVLEKGMSMRAAAQLYEVAESSVWLWVQRFRERGYVRPDGHGGGAPSRIEAERERIFRVLERSKRLAAARLLRNARRRCADHVPGEKCGLAAPGAGEQAVGQRLNLIAHCKPLPP